MPVSTSSGARVLTVREIRTEVTLPTGKRHIGALLILFDSQTGYYLSRFASQPERLGPIALCDGLLANSVAYVDGDRLILFTVVEQAGLYISESNARASGLDDAQKEEVADAKGQLDDIEKGRQRYRRMETGKSPSKDSGPQRSRLREPKAATQ
jgi:hypothetical protein